MIDRIAVQVRVERHGKARSAVRVLVRAAAATLQADDCLGRIGGDEFAAVLCAVDVEEAHRRVATFH